MSNQLIEPKYRMHPISFEYALQLINNKKADTVYIRYSYIADNGLYSVKYIQSSTVMNCSLEDWIKFEYYREEKIPS